MKSKHLLLFLVVYVWLFFILFPGYRYVIDPDSTGYFSVAEQLANGDFYNSINGIWGLLGSWIIAPFIHFNFDEILIAKYLNGLYGLLSLTAFFYLLKKFKINFILEIAIITGAVLLILHFTFYRLFGDLLQLLILLLYLNVICSKKFGSSYKMIILGAVIGGIAFYAKAYAFYFTLIHLPVAIYLAQKKEDVKNNFNLQFIKKAATAIVILLLTISPWIIALNYKYGHYRLGQQNFTGPLSAAYHQPRVVFYKPPFEGAYSIFDDISYLKITNITPFSSAKLLIAELKLIAFNLLKTIEHLNDFSFVFLIIIITGAFLFFRKFNSFINQKSVLLLFSFITLWPAGFLLFHVEPRYLWIMILAVLILAGVLLSPVIENFAIHKKYLFLFSFIIISSFYLYPLAQLKEQYNSGKNYFEIADALKRNNIKGNILYSYQTNAEAYNSVIINFLSKCRHYGPFTKDYTTQEILQAIKKYKINYFILYYSSSFQKDIMLSSTLASNAKTILKDLYPGIIVLEFN
jgi:hypothetical protein